MSLWLFRLWIIKPFNHWKHIILNILITILFLIPLMKAEGHSEPEKTFIYTAKKFGVSLIKAVITINTHSFFNGKKVFQIQARVNSLPNISFFLRMNNRFISIVDSKKFSPISYIKEIDQDGLFIKKKNYKQIIIFNHSEKKIIVEKIFGNNKEEVILPPLTYDPLSIFLRFYLKDEFIPGQDLELSVYDGIKVKDIILNSKKETLKFNDENEVNTVCIESKTSFSSFGEKEGVIRVWYTDDQKKIPILIELILPIGKVRFELEEAMGI